MSAYSLIFHPTSPSMLSHWVLTCPPVHADGMIRYLRHHACKFNRKMERTRWERKHSIDRDVFTIEGCPEYVVQALIKSTQDKGGKVTINEPKFVEPECLATWSVEDGFLDIKFKGNLIQDMCCETASDYDNHIDFNSTFTQIDLLDIKAAIFTAIERTSGTLVVGYDTRICLDIAELFMEYGFTQDENCLVLER